MNSRHVRRAPLRSDWKIERFHGMDEFIQAMMQLLHISLTHWGRVTHICVSKLTIIGSDNGLSPGRRQASIWTNAGILLIRPLGTNFNEMLVEILTFLFMKMRLKVSSGKWRPFCLGLNELIESKLFFTCIFFYVLYNERDIALFPSKKQKWSFHEP